VKSHSFYQGRSTAPDNIRIELEGLGVRLACRNMTDEGLERLATIAAKMTVAGEKDEKLVEMIPRPAGVQ